MNMKRSLLVGAALATVGVGGLGTVGIASADTSSTSDSTSLVDKIASKFNLNKDEVQAVVDEDREAHQAEREAEQKEKLATAVTDGKLTQAQADHITQVLEEIDALRGDAKPDEQSDDLRDQVKDKMDELRDWADENDIDMQYVMVGHGGGRGGPRE